MRIFKYVFKYTYIYFKTICILKQSITLRADASQNTDVFFIEYKRTKETDVRSLFWIFFSVQQ